VLTRKICETPFWATE